MAEAIARTPPPESTSSDELGRRFRKIDGLIAAAAACAMLLGAGVLVGWLADVEVLRSVVPGFVAMKANTAFSFVVIGAALLASARSRRTAARALAAVAGMLAAGTILKYSFGIDLGVDRFPFPEPVGEALGTLPGRMAPGSAIAFLFLSISLFVDDEREDRLVLAQLLGLAASAIGLFGVLTYVFGGRTAAHALVYTAMAVHTAAGLCALGMAAAVRRADRGLVAETTCDAPGGALFRRLFPLVLVVSPALVTLRLIGEEAGLYDTRFGSAIVIASFTVLNSGLLWWAARQENRTDAARRRAELAVRLREQEFRSLAASSPLGMFRNDAQGLCTYTNARWQEIAGLGLEQSLGEGWVSALHPDDREPVLRDWQASAGAGREYVGEFRFRRPSAEIRWVRARAAPVRAETGAVAGWVGTAEDVTERHNVELLRQDLVAGISHDLKNPLSVVLGMAQLLEQDGDGEADDRVQTIIGNAMRASILAENFLMAARTDTETLVPRRQPVDLNQLVERVTGLLGGEAKRLGVDLDADLAGEVPVLPLDPVLVERALVNLVANAVRFAGRGGRVAVATSVDDQALRLSVRDTGPGVPASDRPQLFQRYSKLAGKRRDSTGLGLYVVRMVAEAHGGAVGADCPESGGAEFWMTLPEGPEAAGSEARS